MIENSKDTAESMQAQAQAPEQVTQVDARLEEIKEEFGTAVRQTEHGELVKGAYFVKIWLVTGHNYDRKDIIAGGSRLLGPYTWVHESYKDRWVEDMKRKFGNRASVHAEPGRRLFECDEIPSYEDQMEQFEKYLSDPRNW